MRTAILGLILASGLASTLAAQTAQPLTSQQLQDKLAAAKGLKCTFELEATGTWKKDTGELQGEVKPVKLAVTFTEINADESTARMLSNFGTYDMIVRAMAGSLHFIQPLRSGALYATTVFPKESHPGKFKAVHSRHEYVEIQLPGFTSRPEQYY